MLVSALVPVFNREKLLSEFKLHLGRLDGEKPIQPSFNLLEFKS
jgi:hypothetical protein